MCVFCTHEWWEEWLVVVDVSYGDDEVYVACQIATVSSYNCELQEKKGEEERWEKPEQEWEEEEEEDKQTEGDVSWDDMHI